MKNLSLVLFIGLCTFSCTYVYYPNYPVIAEAKEKGVGGQLTLGFSKAQISGWYSVDSNVFFTGTASGALSYLEERSMDTNNHERYKTFSGTLGVGYNVKIGEDGQFQILGGGGISQGHLFTNVFSPPDNTFFDGLDVRVTSTRLYIQPSIGIDRKGGGFYFIPRLTFENFTRVQPTQANVSSDQLIHRSYTFLDPFIMGRIKSKVVNVDIYTGFSINLNAGDQNTGDEIFIVAQPFTFGLGLSKTF